VYGAFLRFVVKPGKRAEFIEFLRWDAQVARDSEPGTLRFDVWETESEPDVIYVYEAYRDSHAFETHTRNDPYKRFDRISSSLILDWSMVIPFKESITSNLDE
jgi:(4S)-4-hydroxy-5-phosphonooxypentane-2,3-dione isomerase